MCAGALGSPAPSGLTRYHLQQNDFGNEEVRPINSPLPPQQLVKIPFKKFIAQFRSNPS